MDHAKNPVIISFRLAGNKPFTDADGKEFHFHVLRDGTALMHFADGEEVGVFKEPPKDEQERFEQLSFVLDNAESGVIDGKWEAFNETTGVVIVMGVDGYGLAFSSVTGELRLLEPSARDEGVPA